MEHDAVEGDPGNLPQIEAVEEGLSLASRLPVEGLPDDPLWEANLSSWRTTSDEMASIKESLAQVKQTLSCPVRTASKEEIAGIFTRNPGDRSTPWVLEELDDGSYSFASEAYTEPSDGKIIPGVTYSFDKHGRIMQKDVLSDDPDYPNEIYRQERFGYDEDGYCTEALTWERTREPVFAKDRFTYDVDVEAGGHKVIREMAHAYGAATPEGDAKYEAEVTIDLADYEEWMTERTAPKRSTIIRIAVVGSLFLAGAVGIDAKEVAHLPESAEQWGAGGILLDAFGIVCVSVAYRFRKARNRKRQNLLQDSQPDSNS